MNMPCKNDGLKLSGVCCFVTRLLRRRRSDGQSSINEKPDLETSSAIYAARFSSAAGRWMLSVQGARLDECLKAVRTARSLLDVGGGHNQTAPIAVKAGLSVTVTGSDERCSLHLPPDMPFVVADPLALPWPDKSWDVVIAFRLLPHSKEWVELVSEICRVAADRVIVDYPAWRSVNAFSHMLYGAKKRIEKTTRPYMLFGHHEVARQFERHGFTVVRHPQFFWPMVLHRMLNNPRLSQALEVVPRALGMTRLLGSPVILEARRL